MRPLRTAGAVGRTATEACFHTSTQSQTRQPRVHTRKKPEEPQIPPSWRPFEVPEVVLELDSWESEYARTYDKTEWSVQQRKWGEMPRIDATWKRIRNFEYDRQRVSDNFAKVASHDYWRQRWAVTDLDVMTAALRGAPNRRRRPEKKRFYGTDVDGLLNAVACENAIPLSTFQDEKSFLSWLLHRKTVASDTPRISLKVARELISKHDNLEDLRRYVLFLLQQSDNGHWHIHQCNEYIARVLMNVLSKPHENRQSTLLDFLPFFNSLSALLQHDGQPLGPELCGACLVLSAEAFRLRATENFLEHGLKHGYWDDGKPWVSAVQLALAALNRRWDKEAQDNASSQGGKAHYAPGNRSNLGSRKGTLARLLAVNAGTDGKVSFKAVVERNPGHEGLHEQFSRLVARVGSLSS
ncbi:hypothetical protein CSHISOI_03522 [Colletotrichum shisoi]|uniref:Uncharacterized protein n=1 Tax=Colletotrichum shisoi TaxID=2078593 RepID=A0A5Q4C012_9PEZI|nr:hypothetical protein CSHISOI_03522 [Colletotrichum shisoi]